MQGVESALGVDQHGLGGFAIARNFEGCEVDHDVQAVNSGGGPHRLHIADVALVEGEVWIPRGELQIARVAVRHIVVTDHAMPLSQQFVSQVRSEKTRRSGYEYRFHTFRS